MSKKVVNEDETEVNGIKGQLIYPDRKVDAERAGLYAAGKVDTWMALRSAGPMT
jgi:hypothetical protein